MNTIPQQSINEGNAKIQENNKKYLNGEITMYQWFDICQPIWTEIEEAKRDFMQEQKGNAL